MRAVSQRDFFFSFKGDLKSWFENVEEVYSLFFFIPKLSFYQQVFHGKVGGTTGGGRESVFSHLCATSTVLGSLID